MVSNHLISIGFSISVKNWITKEGYPKAFY